METARNIVQSRRAVSVWFQQSNILVLRLFSDIAVAVYVSGGELFRSMGEKRVAAEILLPCPHQMACNGRKIYNMDIYASSADYLSHFFTDFPLM